MARLYQPVVVVLLIVIARVVEAMSTGSRPLRAAIALTVLANASVAFGPVLLNPFAAWVYARFYVHSPPQSMITNLERFGRRPLGFCSDSHAWDNIQNPNTPQNRPAWE